jgi:type IV pilus assembly protein PilM
LGWRQSLNLGWGLAGCLRRGLGKQEVIGLDIGSSAVKMVQLRKDNGGYMVTAAGSADVGPGLGRGQGNPIEAIRKCLASTGAGTRLAVCGVGGAEVAVRPFKFPPLPVQETEGAVSLEADQLCPFNTEDGVVDYQLICDGDDSVSGVLVAATNRVIRKKVQLAKRASLSCVLMDVDGLALLNCFMECEKGECGQAAAILNVASRPGAPGARVKGRSWNCRSLATRRTPAQILFSR